MAITSGSPKDGRGGYFHWHLDACGHGSAISSILLEHLPWDGDGVSRCLGARTRRSNERSEFITLLCGWQNAARLSDARYTDHMCHRSARSASHP